MSDVPKIIFIIPYRDRPQRKFFFEKYMAYILEDMDKNEYKIYFSQPVSGKSFNRGAVKNIGFLAMREKYPNDYKNITFVFNDVDSIPYKKNLLNYETKPGVIKHFYGFTYALGGLFSITGEDFEKILGFPNYWSWGYEDQIIYNRTVYKKIHVDRTQFYRIYDHDIMQFSDSSRRLMNLNNLKKHKELNYNNNFKSIINLNYRIENNIINILNFDLTCKERDVLPYTLDLTKSIKENEKNIHRLKNINDSKNQGRIFIINRTR